MAHYKLIPFEAFAGNLGFSALLLIVFGLSLYFLPTLIGWSKRNAGAIFTLNLLLGWTLIGWVVAIVWAMTNDPEQTPMAPRSSVKVSSVDQITKLTTLREKGAITEIEYQREKEKILNS